MSAPQATGPVTAAGKETVSRNALKHGLTGKSHAALPGEESAFDRHVQGFFQSLAPVGLHEEHLVRAIASNYWRLHRAHDMENELFDRTLDECHAEGTALTAAWLDPRKGLQRIALYAARIQRAIETLTADLQSLQKTRREAFAKARKEAMLLTQLALAKGQTFDPAGFFGPPEVHGGFVYSSDEILRLLIRHDRLVEAGGATPLVAGAK